MMALVHFLNVGEGDCSIIQHDTGNITVIDVCNAQNLSERTALSPLSGLLGMGTLGGLGSYSQKNAYINPIQYMNSFGYNKIFRFILTHPDMDHMDGLLDFCQAFQPTNFWDIENNKSMTKIDLAKSRFNEKDWDFYRTIRLRKTAPTVLKYYAGTENKYFNQDDYGRYGDGLYILAPFVDMIDAANKLKDNDYNDCSYVLMLVSHGRKMIFAGDSHDKTWERILDENFIYRQYIEDIDILIAPHHGRKSDRDFNFLNTLKPKLTLFGIAPSEHLAYNAWNQRGLQKITSNEAGNVLMNISKERIDIYVEKESFAKNFSSSQYIPTYRAYHIGWLQ